jgi:hypothetical protein
MQILEDLDARRRATYQRLVDSQIISFKKAFFAKDMDVGSSPLNQITNTSNAISQIDPGILNALIESRKAGDLPLEDLQIIALNHFYA